MEEALRATSADTLKRITESLAKEEEKKRQKRVDDVRDDRDVDDDDDAVRRRQVRAAERNDRRATTPDEEASMSTSSMSPTPQHFNAKVTKATNDGSERGSSPRGKFML